MNLGDSDDDISPKKAPMMGSQAFDLIWADSEGGFHDPTIDEEIHDTITGIFRARHILKDAFEGKDTMDYRWAQNASFRICLALNMPVMVS